MTTPQHPIAQTTFRKKVRKSVRDWWEANNADKPAEIFVTAVNSRKDGSEHLAYVKVVPEDNMCKSYLFEVSYDGRFEESVLTILPWKQTLKPVIL